MNEKPPGVKNPLKDFTGPEIAYFRENCNFTEEEMMVFNLRIQDRSITYISITKDMSESTVKRINKRIKNKILRVL